MTLLSRRLLALLVLVTISVLNCQIVDNEAPNSHLQSQSPSLVASPTHYSPIPELADLNFGILINNQTHQIYRARRLGDDGLQALKIYLEKKNLPFPKTIIYMNDEGYEPWPTLTFAMEEFHAQQQYGFKFYHSYDFGYRTYLDGDNPYFAHKDIDKRFHVAAIEQNFGPLDTEANKHVDGDMAAFDRIMSVILNPDNQPVLFHCWGGRHRTGMVAMAIRYIQGGKWLETRTQPLKFKSGKKLMVNHAVFEYTRHNLTKIRRENFDFIKQFSEDVRLQALRQQYQNALNVPSVD